MDCIFVPLNNLRRRREMKRAKELERLQIETDNHVQVSEQCRISILQNLENIRKRVEASTLEINPANNQVEVTDKLCDTIKSEQPRLGLLEYVEQTERLMGLAEACFLEHDQINNQVELIDTLCDIITQIQTMVQNLKEMETLMRRECSLKLKQGDNQLVELSDKLRGATIQAEHFNGYMRIYFGEHTQNLELDKQDQSKDQ